MNKTGLEGAEVMMIEIQGENLKKIYEEVEREIKIEIRNVGEIHQKIIFLGKTIKKNQETTERKTYHQSTQ